MSRTAHIETWLPMTETAYFILLSLTQTLHGYGIMQRVEEMTGKRLRIGAGTLYGSLSKMEGDGLIDAVAEEERRKLYLISDSGRALLDAEMARLAELLRCGREVRGM